MGLSSYHLVLPHIFPHLLVIDIPRARELIGELTDNLRVDVSQGSSFAVTVDNWDGTWNLWLSNVSKDFIVTNHPEIQVAPTGNPNGDY